MSISGASDSIRVPSTRSSVRLSNRLFDLAALTLVAVGIAVFAVARRALTALGSGTYPVPKGVTYVARTDLHVAQTRLAIWFITLGFLIGIISSARHHWRSR